MTVLWNSAAQLPALWIGDALGILLILALGFKKDRPVVHRLLILSIVVSLLAHHLTYEVAEAFTNQRPEFLSLFRLPFSLRLLNVSLLYLYVIAVSQPGFELNRSHWKFLTPFLVGILWYAVGILLQQGQWPSEKTLLYDRFARLALGFGIELYVAFRIYDRIARFAAEARKYYSNTHQLRLNWLSVLMAILLLFILVDLMDLLTGPFVILASAMQWATTVGLFFLALFSLKYSTVFGLGAVSIEDDSLSKFMSDEELERLKLRLHEHIEKESPYLNPELRLADLANALNLKPYRLTEVIRRGMGTTFYELINEKRMEKAKTLMSDLRYRDWTILAIATECGFNSKSVFNEVFKKLTGKTPSEFRQNAAQNVRKI